MSERCDQVYREAVKLIDFDEVASLASELVKIPSPNPPGEESEVASLIQRHLTQSQVETTLEEVCHGRPNIYGILRGTEEKPVLMFNGHMDVVPAGAGWTVEPFGGKIENGRLFGRGAADTKGGLAAMMKAMRSIVLTKAELRGTLIFAAVVDEEQAESGTRKMLESGVRSDFAVVAEPTGLRVASSSKGDVYYEITTSGRSAHSATPELGVNAISGMAHVIKGIDKLAEDLRAKKHELLGNPTYSVGIIEGGTATNVVPSYCKVTVDRRTLPGESAKDGEKELVSLINGLRQNDPTLQASVRTLMEASPMEVPSNHPFVLAAREAVRHVLGSERGRVGLSGATDAQLLYNVANIPSVILGPGEFSQAHQADESVLLSEVVEAAKIYMRLALSVLL
jgi:acetylornithine deacetylase/succinyl-diaminopimelate desuccinylase family protein